MAIPGAKTGRIAGAKHCQEAYQKGHHCHRLSDVSDNGCPHAS